LGGGGLGGGGFKGGGSGGSDGGAGGGGGGSDGEPLAEFMRLAIREAELALREDEVPIGAVILRGERVLAAAHNQREQLRDPTAHAEMIAITQAAAAIGDWRLEGCALFVTLEPCPMCAGAILQARIPVVVYGARDPKAGAVDSLFSLLTDSRLNHRCQVYGGVLADECGRMLTDFFRVQRRLGKK
jgi:tRNA(adenine34) deaminase